MFTAIALFIVLAEGYGKITRIIILPILLVSLLAFGGRMAILFSLLGLFLLACAHLRKIFIQKRASLLEIGMIAVGSLAAPLCLAALGYFALQSGIGERIAEHAFWDKSAGSRWFSFFAFHYMSWEEIFFGVSPSRILDIAYRMNLMVPLTNIENPWIVMCMYLGVILFPFWLAATIAFVYRLVKAQPFALQLVVVAYFVIASTSNSFGHKDAGYAIMVSMVICAGRRLSYDGASAKKYFL
jgi:hypothetical protein